MLCPTPIALLTDPQGRPTFLWDCDLTWEALRERLASPDPEVSGYWLGTVMRQAKPDDALQLASAADMRALWSQVAPYLGAKRAFWAWYLEATRVRGL
jgi:hypothetical protein